MKREETGVELTTPPLEVYSADDPRVAPFRNLQQTDPGGVGRTHFVAESEIVIRRLLASDILVSKLLVTPQRLGNLRRLLHGRIQILVAQPPVLNAIVGFSMHRGCAAWSPRPDWSARPALVQEPKDSGMMVVVAERLSDPANLGSLMRNCRALRADLLVADPKGCDPLSRRAIRASMGNVFHMPIWLREPTRAVAELRQRWGARCVVLAATVSARAVPACNVHGLLPAHAHRLLLVGNEGDGLSPSLLATADVEVTVPVAAETDSLNAATAAAVLLYELAGCRLGSGANLL